MVIDQKALLIQAGQAMFGERWQTDMAKALNLSDARRVRQWLAGERSIPVGVWKDLKVILTDRQVIIENVAKQLDGLPTDS